MFTASSESCNKDLDQSFQNLTKDLISDRHRRPASKLSTRAPLTPTAVPINWSRYVNIFLYIIHECTYIIYLPR